MEYVFSEDRFIERFNAKSAEEKSADSIRLTHLPNKAFKLFPYKASGKKQAPIVTELEDIVSPFFRIALGKQASTVDFDSLFTSLSEEIEIDDDGKEMFKEMIHSLFFVDDSFVADNVGLYPYQTVINNKSALNLASYLFSVFGVTEEVCKNIESAKNKRKYNVLEDMIIQTLENKDTAEEIDKESYYCIKNNIQERFLDDFSFMIEVDMTTREDLANLFSIYYFYYVSQTCITLDHYCEGRRDDKVDFYFALDWEKVSKNRLCCISGWDKLSASISHMFSHAITLEIINQVESGEMFDYISFGQTIAENPEKDSYIASEIKRAEECYKSYIGDYKKFDSIETSDFGTETDRAIRHLFRCVEAQFLDTDRRRANDSYNEKFSDFCKHRWVKNRKKSGLVLNLTERDIIFLTKLSLRNQERIRLIDLYKEYEYRGIYLDNTSKEFLQEFFTKLNLIDKKSDSGDAQYVKRIL